MTAIDKSQLNDTKALVEAFTRLDALHQQVALVEIKRVLAVASGNGGKKPRKAKQPRKRVAPSPLAGQAGPVEALGGKPEE